MRTELLGKLITQVRGITYKKEQSLLAPQKGYIPILRAGNITDDQELTFNDLVYVPDSLVKPNQFLRKGDILISTSSGSIKIVGKSAKVNSDLEFSFGAFCKVLRFNENIDKDYAALFFRTENYRETISNLARGGNINNLTNAHIDNLRIPFPSIDKQKAYAQILNEAEDVIRKRKQSITILNELVKSVFLEMFGDPFLNTKNWEQVKMSSFIKGIKSGWSANGENRQIQKDELGVLKVSSVTSGYFKPEQHKAVDKSIIKKQLVHPQKGDLLFSRANTKELVAATCVVDKNYEELFLPDKLWRIDLNKEKVQTFYFKYVLTNRGYRTNLAKKATGTSGSMLNISQVKFKQHLFPLAPIELQKSFESIVEKALAEKQKLEKSLTDSKQLFNSLLQKAFREELELVDENVELQTSIRTINWYESQLSLLKATQAIAKQQRQIEKVLSEPLKNIQAVQETIQKMNLPALEAIKSFQKTLNSLKIPALDAIKTLEQFQIVKDSSTQLGIAEDFMIPAFEEYQEEKRLKEIEEELSRENDPILKYISETQAGKITFANYNVNMPRFIHEEFKGQEFTFEEIINRLGDNYGLVNISEENVKIELFRSFKVFVRTEFNESAFTFNGLAEKLKEKLFNPSFELLHEFIIQELQSEKEIKQAYFPGVMNTEYPEHYKQLKYSESPFRLYLIHTNGNSKN
nr:restriction endonuclease subunit S [uncultured Carboxylicivirga sp.]